MQLNIDHVRPLVIDIKNYQEEKHCILEIQNNGLVWRSYKSPSSAKDIKDSTVIIK
jgi:hypothetical protein